MTWLEIGAVALIVLGLVWLWRRNVGFTAQRPGDYADYTGEALDLRRHLNGPILCEGVIYGPFGRVISRFVGDFSVSWNGDTGVMSEKFTYDSGMIEYREWTIEVEGDGKVTAAAPDVVGLGQGRLCGPTLQLRYRIRLPKDAGGHVLQTVDWMYLTGNGTIVNRSQFRKWGFKVAELVATLRLKEQA